MERKEALKYISSKINEGQSKQQIYQDLLPKIRYKTDLLSYIAEFPDLKNKNQNKRLNTLFIFFLISLMVLQLIVSVFIARITTREFIPWYALGGLFYFLTPIFLIFIIRDVWNFRRSGYRMFFVTAGLNLCVMIKDLDHMFIWLLIIPWIAVAGLSVLILKRVFPHEKLFGKLDPDKLEADLLQNKNGQI